MCIRDRVRHWVGDVVVGHGENGDLGHRAGASFYHARPLVEGGQVRVKIAGVTLSAGNLTLGGGEFPKSLGIRGHIGEDDQHVHVVLVGQVLRHLSLIHI